MRKGIGVLQRFGYTPIDRSLTVRAELVNRPRCFCVLALPQIFMCPTSSRKSVPLCASSKRPLLGEFGFRGFSTVVFYRIRLAITRLGNGAVGPTYPEATAGMYCASGGCGHPTYTQPWSYSNYANKHC